MTLGLIGAIELHCIDGEASQREERAAKFRHRERRLCGTQFGQSNDSKGS
jgi:hypothetical protein